VRIWIPTRKERARNKLGIIFTTAMLTTLAVLWFTEDWRGWNVTTGPI
jgi:hypothetical protein